MRIVVGLGNPVERAADRLGLAWAEEDGPSLVARGRRNEQPFALVKPQTFMNLSGRAVARHAVLGELALADLLVVLDDLDLPSGSLRIRKRGSAGGHRGLESIIEVLGSAHFARLRIGIGSAREQRDAGEYVLAPAEDDADLPLLERSVDSACEAVILWLSWASAEDLMNRFNRRIDSAS
jgi:peptidyl-tRNA hydrolase, PTH1 family